jgi:hypothetical protein
MDNRDQSRNSQGTSSLDNGGTQYRRTQQYLTQGSTTTPIVHSTTRSTGQAWYTPLRPYDPKDYGGSLLGTQIQSSRRLIGHSASQSAKKDNVTPNTCDKNTVIPSCNSKTSPKKHRRADSDAHGSMLTPTLILTPIRTVILSMVARRMRQEGEQTRQDRRSRH